MLKYEKRPLQRTLHNQKSVKFMITQTEFLRLYKQFCSAYKQPFIELQMKAYYCNFHNMSYEQVEAYFIDAIGKYEFMPSASKILAKDKATLDEKAWDKLVVASRAYCPGISTTNQQVKKLTEQLPEVAQQFLLEFGITIETIGNAKDGFYYEKFKSFAKNYQPKNINQKQLGESK